jgi:pimeloyl-ACP methyl ester carboxylesterase
MIGIPAARVAGTAARRSDSAGRLERAGYLVTLCDQRQVQTRSGPASCIDTGGPGRAALFVHGVDTSSYLWRYVIGQLGGQRRCVAVDLSPHRHTPAAADQDFLLPALARFLADCCEAPDLTDVDLVANDTGGAIAQVFAAGHPSSCIP